MNLYDIFQICTRLIFTPHTKHQGERGVIETFFQQPSPSPRESMASGCFSVPSFSTQFVRICMTISEICTTFLPRENSVPNIWAFPHHDCIILWFFCVILHSSIRRLINSTKGHASVSFITESVTVVI